MAFLQNMKIGARLFTGFAVMFALLIALTVVSYIKMSSIQERLDRLVSESFARTEVLYGIRASTYDTMIAIRNLALLTDEVEMKPEAVRVEHGPLIVVAQEDHLALHDQIDAFAGIGAVADDVAKTIDFGHIVFVDIVQNGSEAFQIAVDIADKRFHVDHSPALR